MVICLCVHLLLRAFYLNRKETYARRERERERKKKREDDKIWTVDSASVIEMMVKCLLRYEENRRLKQKPFSWADESWKRDILHHIIAWNRYEFDIVPI